MFPQQSGPAPQNRQKALYQKHAPCTKKRQNSQFRPHDQNQPLLFTNNLNYGEQLFIYSQTLSVSPIAVIAVNHKGIIKYLNPAFLTLTEFSAQELIEKKISSLYRRYKEISIFKHLQKVLTSRKQFQGKCQTHKKSGSSYWQEEFIYAIKHSRGTRYIIGFLQDITMHIQSKKLITHMAFHDLLTDLPNRILFNGELESALKQANVSGQKLAIILLDLDRFKIINDTLGHTIGDQLIQNVASRLREKLDPHDTIARMGGDEFIILLPYIYNFQEIFDKIQAIREMFRQPFKFNHHQLHINVSMGISLYPEDGQDAPSLIKHADAALYEAKNSGRNHHKFYTAKLNDSAFNELAIEMSLRQALEDKRFQLFYQPQVSFKTGKITGVEALIRWHDPELGLIMPDRFIPLAEETGLIVPIGEWVLWEACAQNAAWQKAGFPSFKIAVNLSARQFQEPDLVEKILSICQETGLDPQLLDLEITESILMKDLNITKMILQWLKKKGVSITIDDFGTGYSSLKYLKRFPISTIKIDRSFIRDSLSNPDDAALVTTICSIAQNLNIQIIAEGVETEEQLRFLHDLGCDSFQGYFFSQPLPATELTALLKQGRCIKNDQICLQAIQNQITVQNNTISTSTNLNPPKPQ